MSRKIFDSPKNVEAFFYSALEQRDLNDVMLAWATDDTIICIHPMGPVLMGLEAVRDSWGVICDSGQELSFEIESINYSQSGDLAIHILRENIAMAGDPPKLASMLVTNAYRKTAEGWHMILHHATPAPAEDNELQEPVVLH